MAGEIDTKPIESVQVALTLFGEKDDVRKNRPFYGDEIEKERDLGSLEKDLATCKVQLEAKNSAYLQALLKLEHYQKTADELSTLLRNYENERDVYMEECEEERVRNDKLESKVKELTDQLSEAIKFREQLSLVLCELKATQGELLSMETELAAARESELKALTQAELLEAAANMERGKTKEIQKYISELNEAVFMSQPSAIEVEKDKCTLPSEKNDEIELAAATAVQALKLLEGMREQLEMMQELENQLLAKSTVIESLQMELTQANELLSSSEGASSGAVNNLNQLKADLEIYRGKNLDQAVYIEALEMELNLLKLELKNVNEEMSSLNCDAKLIADELQNVKDEVDDVKARETEAQIEIALLKSELHKGRSKIAAAEAAEARAQSLKSGLYLAVRQLAVEAGEAKKENQRLKQGRDEGAEGSSELGVTGLQYENPDDVEVLQTDKPKEEDKGKGKENENDANVTIPLEEYEYLIGKADKTPVSLSEDSKQLVIYENKCELDILKKELEVATVRIGEFRTRAEQAVSRAEAAEKAKAALEDQLRKYREQKQRRKAALAALGEVSVPKEYSPPSYGDTSRTYQPLGKVLNMKF